VIIFCIKLSTKRFRIYPFLSVISIYIFIAIGYTAKKIYKNQIDQRTLILLSIYFFQPMLTFWGLTRSPINYDLIMAPIAYFSIVLLTMFILIIISNQIFTDQKEKSIAIAASLIGNTGNLGIPLGIAVFGESSIAFTSIINIANVFFIYTIGIYFYARSNYTAKESLIQMAKIPIIWTAVLALLFNYSGLKIPSQLDKILEMGSYTTIVTQLVIFGIYLHELNLKEIDKKFSLTVSGFKLIMLPIVGFIVLGVFDFNAQTKAILLLQLMLPLAVNNVNIAALYDCKPITTAGVIVVSSIFFLFLLYFDLEIVQRFF
jgi:predicted permease